MVMGPYEIVALQDAMFKGSSYNYDMTEGNYLGCKFLGWMFVMTGEQTEALDLKACST